MEAKDFRGLEAAYKAVYVTEAESAGQELAKREKDDDAFGSPNKKKSPRFKVGPEDKKAGTEAWKRYKAGNPNYGLRDDVEWSDEDLIVEKKKDKDTPLQVAAVIDKDRAKKATDDATYDREHGENEKADEDERYSKWERYKMKRDAQRSGHPWKHAKGSTTEKEGKKSEKAKKVYDPLHNKEEKLWNEVAERLTELHEIEGVRFVVVPANIDEEDKWIQGAVKRPGAFTKKAKAAGMTVQQFAKHVDDNKDKYSTRTERQANLAQTFAKMKKEGADFDSLSQYLINEGADEESAKYILANW